MAKKKQNMFAGRTGRSMEKTKNSYGYLKLPEDVNVFKPEGGTEVIFDIVPYTVTDENHLDNKKYDDMAVAGNLWWKRPIKVHRDVGPEGIQVICPTTVGKKCPICEYAAKRRKEGADWDELKEIFPKSRTLFYIVPIDVAECNVDYTVGDPHIMDQSDYTFLDFLDEEISRDIDNEGFPDPYDGLSLQVYWRQKKLGKNKFAEASKIDFIERDEQYDEEFISSLGSLDDILVIKEYKDLESVYFGMEDMGDEEDEVEERKTRPKRTSRKTTRPSRKKKEDPEEVEDDPEDLPDDLEAPEEKKPTRARKTTSRPAAKKPARKPVAKKKEEPKEEPEEKEPTRAPRRKKEDTPSCPHDLGFGVDTDLYDVCDTCEVWEACRDAKNENDG